LSNLIIVGGGQAAHQLVASLRNNDEATKITVVSDEPYRPYYRPPLSKDFLTGMADEEQLYFKPAEFYSSNRITLELGIAAIAICRSDRILSLSNGSKLAYDNLVLATGMRPRHLDVRGSNLPGVFTLRTLDDTIRLRAALTAANRVAIVGGGYIGLEFAAVARKAGLQVVVLERLDRLLSRVASTSTAKYLADLHHSHGVEIIVGSEVTGVTGVTYCTGITTAAHGSIAADLVVVGIGCVPNSELAENAGLKCNGGISVNRYCQTSDPAIFAIGDCAVYRHPLYDRPIRLESIGNAVDQAKCVASFLTGNPSPYNAVPWFWSDQYDVKLQSAGLSSGCEEEAVRVEIDGRPTVFSLRQGKLLAVDAFNHPRNFLIGKKLIESGKLVRSADLVNSTLDLRTLIQG
jgi:3-phenylpropionate/trans-cinnamate dioxygenase ferredoxin reductase subunit